ncbi:MAG: DNA cytosine methyltransferase [Clostridia bacterium]|nr:DNA cytosine methyltransferase [Clostridia bacterium]
MNILSLFDGMGCGYITLRELGVPVDRYVAYEIDKYAIQTALHNFPDIEQRGDVKTADFTEFEGFDWVLAGFPCTKFSIAQKKDRETKPYSGEGWELFEEAWRAVQEAKPKYFLFENNKSMAKAVQQEISKIIGFEPVLINSALVSAQNRQRIYWVGVRNADGTYSKVAVEQPADRGILLKDVLDDSCFVERDKAYCLKHQAGNARDYFKKHHTNVKFEPVIFQTPRGKNIGGAKYNKSPTLTANGSWVENNKVVEPVCVAERGRYTDSGNRSQRGNNPVEQFYEAREDGKTNALTTVQKDNAVAEPVRIGTYPNNAKNPKHDSQQYRIYSHEGKSVALCGNGGGMGAKTGLYAIPVEFADGIPTKAISAADGKVYPVYEVKNGLITVKGKQYPIKLKDGYYIIRKLTVSECRRLQTIPDWYEMPCSDSQNYKILGNGWTVEVIKHLVSSALAHETPQRIYSDFMKGCEI